jgi:MbtH protein
MPSDAFEQCQVVINEEEQYSIWPLSLAIPDGWRPVGISGEKQDCLQYIEENWIDMRPRSLREEMAQRGLSLEGEARPPSEGGQPQEKR